MSALEMPPSDSAITLGSTTTANKDETRTAHDALVAIAPHQGQRARWLELFHHLPTELHIHIMEVMEEDPVAQICFGLTNLYFYQVYHIVKDYVQYDGTKVYPIKVYPLDLRMQMSTCGEYMYHGWVTPWTYLDYQKGIEWHPRLGRLLQDETIWGGLIYCEECAKYKPKQAFEKSDYERSIEEKGLNWRETLDEILEGKTDLHCRRCRAKVILIYVEKRDEWKDDQILEEEQTSLGLRKLDWETLIVDGDPLRSRMTLQNFLEIVGGYGTWERVFEKLDL